MAGKRPPHHATLSFPVQKARPRMSRERVFGLGVLRHVAYACLLLVGQLLGVVVGKRCGGLDASHHARALHRCLLYTSPSPRD